MSLRTRLADMIRGSAEYPPYSGEDLATFLRGPVTKSIDTSVITLDRPVWGSGLAAGFPRFNPDDLVGKKGLVIYAKMRTDEQVKAVTTFKRDAILSRGWTLEWDEQSPLSQDEQDGRMRVVDQVMQRMEGSFIDALNVIATGREYGFSLSEKVYKPVDVDGKTWVGLRQIRGRDPSTFRFYTDEYGELNYVEQMMAGRRIRLDTLDKFIHYVHNPEFDPYLGQSELREAYRSWYMKDTFIRLWAHYMEKLGGGLTIAQVSQEANLVPNSREHIALKQALADLKNSAGLLLPNGVTAQVHFPTGTDSFKGGIEWHDLAIAKAMLVPNLMGVSSQGRTGSYAQSQTQLESFAWTLRADTDRLENCIDQQLIRDLGDQNWDDGEYPRFKFKPLSTQAMMQLITTWATLIGAKAVIPTEDDEDRLREILEMPPREDTTKTLVQTSFELNAKYGPQPGEQGGGAAAPGEQGGGAAGGGSRGVQPPKVRAPVGRGFHRAPVAAFTRAMARVQFAVIDHRTNAIVYNNARNIARFSARAASRMLDPSAMPGLLDQDVQDIADLRVDSSILGKIKGACKEALVQSWDFGVQQARRELARARQPATLDQARFAALRQKTADFIEANGFRMAQNLTEGMRAIVQQELLQGVKSGARPEAITAQIYDRLIRQGYTTLEALRAEDSRSDVMDEAEQALGEALGTANVPAYLNTLVRTNTFEALNEARYEEFTDPALADFVLALEYSAILDDRTTEICRELDGSVWRDDSPNWDTYRPPNHYNCRSVLVPVTTLDGWDGEESPDPDVEPQAGFARDDHGHLWDADVGGATDAILEQRSRAIADEQRRRRDARRAKR